MQLKNSARSVSVRQGVAVDTDHVHFLHVCVKDLKQQNQYQVFERQLDESRCAMQELQRENTALKKQLKERWDNFVSLT